MQYLVNVSGEISDQQSKTYIVSTSSPEDAQIIASRAFCDEFSANLDSVHTAPQRRTTMAIGAFIFMLIPILLSLINWKSGHDTISISPDYLSCLYSILFYTAFIVRFKGIHRAVCSWIDILLCVFSVLLLSTFVKTILITETFSLLGLVEIEISTNLVLPIAIILSWLGLKVVSLACMAFICITALFNITALSDSMGAIFGSLYIVCSFVGIMMYLSIEPAFTEAKKQIGHATIKSLSYLREDVKHAKHKLADTKIAVADKVKNLQAKNTQKGTPNNNPNETTKDDNIK